RQPETVVKAAAEELEVLSARDEGAEGNERQQPEVEGDGDRNPDRGGACERAGGEDDEDRRRDPRPERTAVQLVESVRADAEAEEEGRHRQREPCSLDVRGEGRADDDVAQVPGRVRQVEQRHVVAPAAGSERVEGGTCLAHARLPQITIAPPRLKRRCRNSSMPAARQSSSWRSNG